MEQDREEYDRKVQAISKQVETFGEIFFFTLWYFLYFQLTSKDALLERQREMIGAAKKIFEAWDQNLPEQDN